MDDGKRTGVPVQEFTFGNVKATVWANKPVNGELFLKVSLCRIGTSADGGKEYRSSFYPEDLWDISDVAVRTAAWVQEAAGILLHRKENGAGPARRAKPVQQTVAGAASPGE